MKHNTVSSAWVSVDNRVYDVTDFIYDHPAGSRLILQNAGKDITYHVQFHSAEMMKILKPRLIGRIIEGQKEKETLHQDVIKTKINDSTHTESHARNHLLKKGRDNFYKGNRSSSSL